MAKRHLAKRNLADWCRYATEGFWREAPHHTKICELLESVERGELSRLMITLAPRHGKSFLSSELFPPWYLGRNPDKSIILSSYESSFAASWGKKARAKVESAGDAVFGITTAKDSRASNWWSLAGKRGGMATAGAGGAITGKGASLFIIDDPIKGAEEARSQVIRDKIWDWYREVVYTRLTPDGAIVIIMTRWHEDDLVGRLLAHAKKLEGTEDAEDWTVVDFPALCDDPANDVLGREMGEALWPDQFSEKKLRSIRAQLGSQSFQAMYQGSPTLPEGNLFKSEWLRRYRHGEGGQLISLDGVLNVMRGELSIFTTIDLAFSTKASADFTVIGVWGWGGNHLWLLEIIRDHFTERDLSIRLERAEEDWRVGVHWVEEGAFRIGEGTIRYLRERGHPIRVLDKDHGISKDKEQRAHDATPRLEDSRVLFPEWAPWWDVFESELLSFPVVGHDDQVDVLSYGVAVAPWESMRDFPEFKRQRVEAPSYGLRRPPGY